MTVQRILSCLNDGWMRAESEVVICTEVDDLIAIGDFDIRPLRTDYHTLFLEAVSYFFRR